MVYLEETPANQKARDAIQHNQQTNMPKVSLQDTLLGKVKKKSHFERKPKQQTPSQQQQPEQWPRHQERNL
jgi:hypothetical protein